MSNVVAKQERKQQILEALMRMLGEKPLPKITTAKLAEQVGVTEAALYRHFPSKAKMYEGLMEYVEQSMFGLLHQIVAKDADLRQKCLDSVYVLLAFAEQNPGMVRLLTSEVLVGEKPRLRERVQQFFDRYETELRQMIRQAELEQSLSLKQTAKETASLLVSLANGYLLQFSRSDFREKPLALWNYQQQLLTFYA